MLNNAKDDEQLSKKSAKPEKKRKKTENDIAILG